jgi:GTP-binding protein
LLDEELMADIAAQLEGAGAADVVSISGATGAGIDSVLDRVLAALPEKSSVEISRGNQESGEWSPI